MQTPGWKAMPDTVKTDMIDDVFRNGRRTARARLLAQHPELMQEQAALR